MSFFSELGAGIRTAAKEYNEIKTEFVTIKEDVTSGVKNVANETRDIATGAKKTVSEGAAAVTSVAKDAKETAKKTIGGKISIQ